MTTTASPRITWTATKSGHPVSLDLRIVEDFAEVRSDVHAIRRHFPQWSLENAFDHQSHHLVGYLEDQPLICVRMTMGSNVKLPFQDYYSTALLEAVAPNYSCCTRMTLVPRSGLPLAAVRQVYVEAGKLGLSLGSRLEVSNCQERGVNFYKRLGYIVDQDDSFDHPELNMLSFPIYFPVCWKTPSFLQPHISQRTPGLDRCRALDLIAMGRQSSSSKNAGAELAVAQ